MTAALPTIIDLAIQAAEWRLIGLLFEEPTPEWRTQVAILGAEVADPNLQRAATAVLEEASPELYHSIFGPGGPASAREASYFDNIQLGYLIAELDAHYQAFAFQPSSIEAPDHLSVEAGFIAYLRLKESFACFQDDLEHAQLTHEAAAYFTREHLARMAAPLHHKLAESEVEYLTLAARALLDRAGNRNQPTNPLPILQDLNDSQFECGAGSANNLA